MLQMMSPDGVELANDAFARDLVAPELFELFGGLGRQCARG